MQGLYVTAVAAFQHITTWLSVLYYDVTDYSQKRNEAGKFMSVIFPIKDNCI